MFHVPMQASALSDNILIPPVSIPLDPQRCSCESLKGLAESIDSPLEHDCMTNEDCDGVWCEFDLFGTVYHLETLLLSCEDPPALAMVVEDVNKQPLHVTNFSRTGIYSLGLGRGFNIPLGITMVHHPYSVNITVSE